MAAAITATQPPPMRARRLAWTIWGGAAVFVLSILAAVAGLVAKGHHEAMTALEQRAGQLSDSVLADINRTLLGVDLALLGVGNALKPAWRADGSLDRAHAAELLAGLNDRHLAFTDVAVIDSGLRTMAAALPDSRRDGIALPPGFAQAALADASGELLLSDPAASTTSGELVMHAARHLRTPDGSTWLAVAEIPATMLVSIASHAPDTPGLAMTLERDDGRLMASAPRTDRLVGQPLPAPLARRSLDGVPRVVPGRLDGQASVLVARPTLQARMVATVGISLDAGLAAWRGSRNAMAAAAAAFVALTLVAAGLVHWQIRRLDQARRELARSAAALDAALSSMAEGLLLCDAGDCVLRWNERYLEFFPWLRPVIGVGVPFLRLAEAAAPHVNPNAGPHERAAWIERRMGLHLAGNRTWSQVLPSGIAVNALERRTPGGGVISVYRDVSAAERRLAQAKAAAEAANEAKSRFLANMSHEMRTPLNAVLGLNELLLASSPEPGQRAHLELMRASGQLLLALINDILDLSRVEAGRLELECMPFRPHAAVNDVVGLLGERARAKQLGLSIEAAGTHDPLLMGDPVRLRQVLFNLVGNAVKFTERGEVIVALATTPLPDGRLELAITVRDTGIGIEPERLPQLFERFTQGDSGTARRYGGSGLGLAITREIVTLMGGAIDARSRPGAGSEFEVRIPFAAAPAAEPDAPAPAAMPGASRAAATGLARRRLRILVAEDNPVNQVVVQAMLERLGHEPQLVADGAEAVQSLAEGRFDLVLMDMQMPTLDGLAATRALRALPPPAGTVPVIAMTANALPDDRAACLAAGMDDYLTKPLDMAELAGVLDRAATPQDTAAVA